MEEEDKEEMEKVEEGEVEKEETGLSLKLFTTMEGLGKAEGLHPFFRVRITSAHACLTPPSNTPDFKEC